MMRAVTLALASLATAHAWSRTRCGDPAGGADIPTPWAADVATRLASAEGVWPEYPAVTMNDVHWCSHATAWGW